MSLTYQMPLTEQSQVGEARRMASSMAADAGFDEDARGKVSLVATELATNVIKHGGGGSILFNRLDQGGVGGLEMLAIDKGKGMRDVARCMVDGYSTHGSPGKGLGAIERLTKTMQIYSIPDQGTLVMARLWAGQVKEEPGWEVGGISIPYPGEQVCGDAWSVKLGSDRQVFLVVDGLGHGPAAAAAAKAATDAFAEQAHLRLEDLMAALHGAMRSTRGAAVGLAEIDTAMNRVRFVGIGNISACAISLGSITRNMVSFNGIVGHEMRKVQGFDYEWSEGSTLVMHSDGIGTSWRINQYPGLLIRAPSMIAAALVRDYTRGRDDATVLIARRGEW